MDHIGHNATYFGWDTADEVAARKDTVVIGLPFEFSDPLDPALCYDLGGEQVLQIVYEKLVEHRSSDHANPAPQLAESWEVAEDSRTWIFHLRRDAVFASGNPVEANDVIFSLRRSIALAGYPSRLLTQFGITADSITQIDQHTVQIVLDRPYPAPMFITSLMFYSYIVDTEVVLAHEQNGDLGSRWLFDHSAGSGPYILDERRNERLVTLKANKAYWQRTPEFERVVMKTIPEPAEQVALLQTGELDIAQSVAWEDLPALESNPDVQVFQNLGTDIKYLGMNVTYAPFASPDVRDTVRYAIDYDGLIDYVLAGVAVKRQGFIPEGFLGYTPDTPYVRDVEKAKALLTAGGYPNGFEVELKCVNASPWLEIALKVRDDLAEIGVTVHLLPMSMTELRQAVFARDVQMWLLHAYWAYADTDYLAKWFAHCDSAGDDASVKGAAWFAHYVNPETSALVDQAFREVDPQKRSALYQRINEIIMDDGPFVFLYTSIRHYAVRTEVVPFIKASGEDVDESPNVD